MEFLAYLILLAIGMFLLIKGADIFVDASSNIAREFNISEMLIGMTLVCFGTGLPELCLSIMSGIRNNSGFVIGNVIGSNIFNMCAILGIVSIMHPIKLLTGTVRKDMKMSLVTALVFLIVMFDTPFTELTQNVISRTDGLILLIFFGVYLFYNIYEFGGITQNTRKKKEEKLGLRENSKQQKKTKEDKKRILIQFGICLIGGILVYLGSELTLNSAVKIAGILKISDILVSALIIATGTSLPEIATSIVAVKKGKMNIAIGNLIGSNMMNMLFVAGLTAVINPIILPINSIWVDAFIFVVVCILLMIRSTRMFIKKGEYQLSRTDGIILLISYIIYVIHVVYRG